MSFPGQQHSQPGEGSESDVHPRLLRTEQQIATLTAEQRALTSNVVALTESMTGMREQITDGFDKVDIRMGKLAEAGRPQWQTVAAMFGVVVVVITWFAKSEIGPIIAEQQDIKAHVENLSREAEMSVEAAATKADRLAEQNAAARERLARLEEVQRLQEVGLIKLKGAQ